MKKELIIGILILVLSIVLRQFTAIPDFVLGILVGLSIGLSLLALLRKSTRNKLKVWKRQKIDNK